MFLQIRNVVLCDDLRKEVSGKEILIGVFPGDLLVADFPGIIEFAVWFDALVLELGKRTCSIRVMVDETMAGELRLDFDLTTMEAMGVGTPKMPILVEKPSLIRINISQNNEDWSTIKEFKVHEREKSTSSSVSLPPPSRPPPAAPAS